METFCLDNLLAMALCVIGVVYMLVEVLSHGHLFDGRVVNDYPVVRTFSRVLMLFSTGIAQTLCPSVALLGLAFGFVGFGMVICLSTKAEQGPLEQFGYFAGAVVSCSVFILGMAEAQTCLAAVMR